jgi:hypothetical protein
LGLLIEQSSTNLILQSQNAFNTANYTKFGCTAADSAITSPDGTTTGSSLTGTAGSYTQYFVPTNATSLGISSASTNTLSIYLKAGTISSVRLYIYNAVGGTSLYGTFNLTTLTGVAGGSAGTPTISIVDAGNGWRRVTVTGNLGGSVGQFAVPVVYADNGTFYMYGFQCEALTFATSYIPTTTAQVTRASDVAVMTGTNFSSWYNPGQGSIVVQAKPPNATQVFSTVLAFAGATPSQDFIYLGRNGTNATGFIYVSNVSQGTFNFGTWANGTTGKTSISYATNNVAFCFNGGTVTTNTTASIPTLIKAYIGNFSDGGSTIWNGTIAKVSYYPTALTSAQLQALTT